jgi:hypothetical protein
MFSCRDTTPQIGSQFWKKHFITQLAVIHCDPSSPHVWLLVGGGGMWDGQGLKEPCFFKLFLESQNLREKLNLRGRKWVH